MSLGYNSKVKFLLFSNKRSFQTVSKKILYKKLYLKKCRKCFKLLLDDIFTANTHFLSNPSYLIELYKYLIPLVPNHEKNPTHHVSS